MTELAARRRASLVTGVPDPVLIIIGLVGVGDGARVEVRVAAAVEAVTEIIGVEDAVAVAVDEGLAGGRVLAAARGSPPRAGRLRIAVDLRTAAVGGACSPCPSGASKARERRAERG